MWDVAGGYALPDMKDIALLIRQRILYSVTKIYPLIPFGEGASVFRLEAPLYLNGRPVFWQKGNFAAPKIAFLSTFPGERQDSVYYGLVCRAEQALSVKF